MEVFSDLWLQLDSLDYDWLNKAKVNSHTISLLHREEENK